MEEDVIDHADEAPPTLPAFVDAARRASAPGLPFLPSAEPLDDTEPEGRTRRGTGGPSSPSVSRSSSSSSLSVGLARALKRATRASRLRADSSPPADASSRLARSTGSSQISSPSGAASRQSSPASRFPDQTPSCTKSWKKSSFRSSSTNASSSRASSVWRKCGSMSGCSPCGVASSYAWDKEISSEAKADDGSIKSCFFSSSFQAKLGAFCLDGTAEGIHTASVSSSSSTPPRMLFSVSLIARRCCM